MSWDDAASAAQNAGISKWVKVQPGDSNVVVFLGAPEVKHLAWSDELGGWELYDKSKHSRASVKFRANVIDISEHGAQGPAQILEFGPALMRDFERQRHKFPMSEWAYEISREGTGLNTKWSATLDKRIDDVKGLREHMQTVELHDIAETWPSATVDEVPF